MPNSVNVSRSGVKYITEWSSLLLCFLVFSHLEQFLDFSVLRYNCTFISVSHISFTFKTFSVLFSLRARLNYRFSTANPFVSQSDLCQAVVSRFPRTLEWKRQLRQRARTGISILVLRTWWPVCSTVSSSQYPNWEKWATTTGMPKIEQKSGKTWTMTAERFTSQLKLETFLCTYYALVHKKHKYCYRTHTSAWDPK